VHGLTQAEAAKRAGVSVSGMKSRVQRAREQLKAMLLRCCEIDVDRRAVWRIFTCATPRRAAPRAPRRHRLPAAASEPARPSLTSRVRPDRIQSVF
jgi:hypothetical protein